CRGARPEGRLGTVEEGRAERLSSCRPRVGTNRGSRSWARASRGSSPPIASRGRDTPATSTSARRGWGRTVARPTWYVYERWPGLGGQVATLDVGAGEPPERYYHHLFTSDRHIAALYG